MKVKEAFAVAAAAMLLVAPAAAFIQDREDTQSFAGDDAGWAIVSPGYGDAGLPYWTSYAAPEGLAGAGNAGEPTIGIPWNTDSVFYKSRSSTYRVDFDDDMPPVADWQDVHPIFLIGDVDPMLHADPVTNRVWTGGLDGPCSLMAFSDDNGETWLPTGNMCSGVQFDHQTVGSGRFANDALSVAYPHVMHYCGQLLVTACASSYDGGLVWTPPTLVTGPCGGLHGHVRVSPVTGTAIVPHRNCGGPEGFAFTTTDGLLWDSMAIPATPGDTRFDPSAQFTMESGWLYYGDATLSGAYIGLSRDEGATWDTIGTSHGEGSTMLNVGALHDPPVVVATFADVQAGDDDRVAYSFLGLMDTDGDGANDEYGEPHNDCDVDQTLKLWYYFVAMSYDGGQTWTVQRVTEDPVQVGGIYGGQNSVCRNLLDFNDMDIDSTGRVHIAWSDGCTGPCVDDVANGDIKEPTAYDEPEGYRTRDVRILRQTTGNGLFAEFDIEPPFNGPQPVPVADDTGPAEDRGAPAAGALGVLAVVVAMRRRSRG